MELFVVLLDWNALGDTVRCLERLRAWKRLAPRIVVVDNGSAPSESEAIGAACPDATVLRSERNLGFAGGTNLGLCFVLESSARIESTADSTPILLLNNDASLSEDSAATLLDALERDPGCAIVGPLVYSETRSLLSAGSQSPVLSRDHTIRTPLSETESYPVASVSGVAAVLRGSALRHVGLLDERYFFGLELADWCRRAQAKGYSCRVEPRARAEHDIERSSQLRQTLYLYYVVRNRFLYARRFHRKSWPLIQSAWALYGLQQSVRLRRQGRSPRATAIRLGVSDGLRGRFGGQNERVLEACARS